MASTQKEGRSYRIAEIALDHLLNPVATLIDDDAVTEILINRDDDIWFERHGRLHPYPVSLRACALNAATRLFSTLSETLTLDQDGTLEGHWRGWRITVVVPPVSRDGTVMALRRHSESVHPIESWVHRGIEIAPHGGLDDRSMLRSIVLDRKNILVSGATGAGKTSLLAGLMAEIPSTQRVLTLEDTPELPPSCAHQVRLISRRGHTLQSLLRLSLRLRPDRLIMGEVRGPEAFDLVQAMATGHEGCMGTIHAAHAAGALARLESLILMADLHWSLDAIRRYIAEWIHVVIHVMRDPKGRFIQEVLKVDGLHEGQYRLAPLSLH